MPQKLLKPVKQVKNIKKVARKKIQKKLASESDFEQSVRKRAEKQKKKRMTAMENSRQLRNRKRKQKSSGSTDEKDSDYEDFKPDFKRFLRILKFKHRKNVMIR